MNIPIIHPHDFDSADGQKKIIVLLHTMDAKIRALERAVHQLSHEEKVIEKDIQELIKTEDMGPTPLHNNS